MTALRDAAAFLAMLAFTTAACLWLDVLAAMS